MMMRVFFKSTNQAERDSARVSDKLDGINSKS